MLMLADSHSVSYLLDGGALTHGPAVQEPDEPHGPQPLLPLPHGPYPLWPQPPYPPGPVAVLQWLLHSLLHWEAQLSVGHEVGYESEGCADVQLEYHEAADGLADVKDEYQDASDG